METLKADNQLKEENGALIRLSANCPSSPQWGYRAVYTTHVVFQVLFFITLICSSDIVLPIATLLCVMPVVFLARQTVLFPGRCVTSGLTQVHQCTRLSNACDYLNKFLIGLGQALILSASWDVWPTKGIHMQFSRRVQSDIFWPALLIQMGLSPRRKCLYGDLDFFFFFLQQRKYPYT